MRTAGSLLLIVCIAKLIALFSGQKFLLTKEELTGISYATLMASAAVVEAIIGTSAVFFPRSQFSIYSVGWLGVLFTGYKVIRHVMDFRGPCHCMGSLFSWWLWGQTHETLLSWFMTAILLVSSGICVFSTSAYSRQCDLIPK
jgi:hypothetical protein